MPKKKLGIGSGLYGKSVLYLGGIHPLVRIFFFLNLLLDGNIFFYKSAGSVVVECPLTQFTHPFDGILSSLSCSHQSLRWWNTSYSFMRKKHQSFVSIIETCNFCKHFCQTNKQIMYIPNKWIHQVFLRKQAQPINSE